MYEHFTCFWFFGNIFMRLVMFFDTHTHLNDKKIDYIKVIKDFKQNEISGCIICGDNFLSSKKALAIAEKNNGIFASIGTHPHESKYFDDEIVKFLENNHTNPKVVAIGEVGLDYYYNFSEKEVQRRVFEEQIKLAGKFKLPLIFHVRDAFEDFFKIVEASLSNIKSGAVVHSFSGDEELAKKILNYGFYISFNGMITFKNADNLRRVVKSTPLNKILIETDCPYLTPEPFRGKVNEPKFVKQVAEEIAKIKSLSVNEVKEQTYKNAKNLFTKMGE